MNLKRNLIKRFAGPGTMVNIEPYEGVSKKLRLNRKVISIEMKRGEITALDGQLWRFSTVGESESYLIYCEETPEGDIYRAEAKGDAPFLHNGVVVMKSYLRKGDILDFGYNRLTVLSEIAKLDCELPWKTWPEKTPISIEGETGVGKTRLAKKVHEQLHDNLTPFIAINLSSYNENLIESELFGHEKGSFTGAICEKQGAIERAKNGTLFIDEIDSLPKSLQVKLLTFLDDQTFYKVGGHQIKKAKCRIIFASGRSLKVMVAKEYFRMDLYFRITSGLSYMIPALRERKETQMHLLKSFEEEEGVIFSREAKKFYLKCEWPGNIRQYLSHLKRKKLESGNRSLIHLSLIDHELLENEFLKKEIRTPKNLNSHLSLKECKKEYCERVLLKCKGSIPQAAKTLGVAKSTLKRVIAS